MRRKKPQITGDIYLHIVQSPARGADRAPADRLITPRSHHSSQFVLAETPNLALSRERQRNHINPSTFSAAYLPVHRIGYRGSRRSPKPLTFPLSTTARSTSDFADINRSCLPSNHFIENAEVELLFFRFHLRFEPLSPSGFWRSHPTFGIVQSKVFGASLAGQR